MSRAEAQINECQHKLNLLQKPLPDYCSLPVDSKVYENSIYDLELANSAFKLKYSTDQYSKLTQNACRIFDTS